MRQRRARIGDQRSQEQMEDFRKESTEPRTPLAHRNTHRSNGSDPITAEMINTYNKQEIDEMIAGITGQELQGYYTKEETDAEIDTALEEYYTKAEIDAMLEDYYTKEEVDQEIADAIEAHELEHH